MAYITLAALLLLLAVADVKGAEKELAETCDPAADTCGHPTLDLVCDAFALKCLIKDSQTCSTDGNGVLCTTGAECDTASTNQCKCKASVYTASAGICTVSEDKYGGACPASGTCLAASNLQCVNSKCACLPDFVVDLATGACVAIAVSKNGKVCTAAGSECGDAATTFMTCPAAGGQCSCQAGYFAALGVGPCVIIAAKKVGKTCIAATAATEAECGLPASNTWLECVNSACACSAGYYGVPTGSCYPAKGKVGGSCTGSGQGTCADTNAECTGTPTACACKTGYSTNGLACAITAGKIGGSCTTATINTKGDCEDSNALCSATTGGTCFCATGYTGVEAAGCTITPTKLGGACTTTTAGQQGNCEDANAVCSAISGGTCSCKSGYSGSGPAATCVADDALGGSCTAASAGVQGTCTNSNAVCSAISGGTCSCKPGYYGTSSCSAITANMFGGSCTTATANTKGTCIDTNGVCPSTTGGYCQCASGFTGIPNGGCASANAVGGLCTTATAGTTGTCTDANSVCSAQVGGTCVCKSSYTLSGSECKSGAAGVMISAVSIALAATLCLLFAHLY